MHPVSIKDPLWLKSCELVPPVYEDLKRERAADVADRGCCSPSQAELSTEDKLLNQTLADPAPKQPWGTSVPGGTNPQVDHAHFVNLAFFKMGKYIISL